MGRVKNTLTPPIYFQGVKTHQPASICAAESHHAYLEVGRRFEERVDHLFADRPVHDVSWLQIRTTEPQFKTRCTRKPQTYAKAADAAKYLYDCA